MDRITVIVPLDGSAASEQAVPMARALAGALHADVQLVYVVEEHAFLDALPRPLLADDVAAQRYLASIAHSLPDAHVTTRVLRGNAAAELLELTRNACSALLVMATHGRGGVGRLVFGSVTDKVVREVAVPVVTVRAAADVTSASAAIPALQTIVVALDGSALAESTLPWATVLAQSTGATVQLVRVNEPIWHAAYLSLAPEAVYLDEAEVAELEARSESGSRAYLDRLAGALRAEGVRVVWETRVGRSGRRISPQRRDQRR